MEKLKQYKYIILILLIVLGFAFYWYEWRPTQIKKECYYRSQLSQSGGRLYRLDGLGITLDESYKNCLRQKGF